jgi:hypothetical protein
MLLRARSTSGSLAARVLSVSRRAKSLLTEARMPITLSSPSAQRIRRVEGRQRPAFDPSLTFHRPRPNDRGGPKADRRLSASAKQERKFPSTGVMSCGDLSDCLWFRRVSEDASQLQMAISCRSGAGA